MKSTFRLLGAVASFVMFLSTTSFAQSVDRPFDFTVSSNCPDCISFGNYAADFTLIPSGMPTRVRFYYSSYAYGRPEETSEYFELPIVMNYQTHQVEVPEITLGHWGRSQYSFAYGLVSENGTLLYFMSEGEFDTTRHMIDLAAQNPFTQPLSPLANHKPTLRLK